MPVPLRFWHGVSTTLSLRWLAPSLGFVSVTVCTALTRLAVESCSQGKAAADFLSICARFLLEAAQKCDSFHIRASSICRFMVTSWSLSVHSCSSRASFLHIK